MAERSRTFADRYQESLTSYVRTPGEAGRTEAYTLGRDAVAEGVSLLDLAIVHQQAVASLAATAEERIAAQPATEFYLEALSTFDMAQRGYLEAQERARTEAEHAEQLARLNEAAVAVASVDSYADRLATVVRFAGTLVGASLSALIAGETEAGTPSVESDHMADLRAVAAKARSSRQRQIERAKGEWLLAVPISRGGSLMTGALVVSRADEFADEEIAIIEQFGRYATLALDIAARLEHEHDLAITLQRTLLPPTPPQVSGLQVAWRYLPAEAHGIGGDWYDVFNLDNGDTVLVVGDVMGHDLHAAAIMGQLRLALQAYAVDGYPPVEVVDRADRLLQRLDPNRTATLAYALIDSDRRHLRLTNAGHPPPVMLLPDGSVSLLRNGLSVPLGTDDPSSARHVEADYALERGTTLLLYTDGLIEDRTRDVDDGLAQLMRAVSAGRGSPEEICERALSVRAAAREDDVCVLCASIL